MLSSWEVGEICSVMCGGGGGEGGGGGGGGEAGGRVERVGDGFVGGEGGDPAVAGWVVRRGEIRMVVQGWERRVVVVGGVDGEGEGEVDV